MSGIDVILPKMVEFIPMVIAFVLVAIVLYKFGWPAFEGMLNKRASKIQDDLKASEKKRLEAENLLESYKKQLEIVERQCDEMIVEARDVSVNTAAHIEKEAKINAKATIDKAKLSISQDRRVAEQQLKSDAVKIAVSVVEKIVGKDMTDDEHRKLIAKYVKEAGSLKG
ncbi:MAG: F0F1 ATP synthase subunit B [Coriobacteriia bacterium]|nr:F0F1 ATP synthase subunit B [Coriobacteriia bacterium]